MSKQPSGKRIHKLTMAWSVLGTLGMLAAGAVLAAPASPVNTGPRAGSTPRVERAARPASVPSGVQAPAGMAVPVSDARLDQFVADARALWPELSPDVREMVLELVRSHGRQADLATLTSPATPPDRLADARKLQGTQAFVTE